MQSGFIFVSFGRGPAAAFGDLQSLQSHLLRVIVLVCNTNYIQHIDVRAGVSCFKGFESRARYMQAFCCLVLCCLIPRTCSGGERSETWAVAQQMGEGSKSAGGRGKRGWGGGGGAKEKSGTKPEPRALSFSFSLSLSLSPSFHHSFSLSYTDQESCCFSAAPTSCQSVRGTVRQFGQASTTHEAQNRIDHPGYRAVQLCLTSHQ